MTADALWEQFRSAAGREPAAAPAPERQPRATDFLASAEGWVTFALVLVAFMAVALSIESTNWVDEMPSLLVAALAGLVTGWVLAHAPWPALPLHLLGIGVGLVLTVAQTMHTMELEDPLLRSGAGARWDELWGRTGEWLRAAVEGGISLDPLPFVLMVVFGVWGISYLGAWAVFRLHNVWLALVPAGVALLSNISYRPGQPQQEFIVFLFASILLVTRLHYLRALREWERQRTRRTPYLSFEVLSYATWIGLALIVAAWIVPTANNWSPLADAWRETLRPVSDRVDRVGRLFVGVGSKRDRHVHTFAESFPLRGKVTLDDEQVLLRVTAPEPLYLRGAAYDQYTGNGWEISELHADPLPGTSVEAAAFGTRETRAELRSPVAVEVTVERSVTSRRLFFAGDPLAVDIDAKLLTGIVLEDAVGLRPESRVRDGDTYAVVGTVSAAPLERLLASGRDYPPWVRERYLALPDDLPPEVRALAVDVAAGAEQPYVVARRVEQFLRETYPFDLRVPNAPPRRDAVAYFLFDAQRGYFDHHASAMAVMLRALGIPTRVAIGFTLDEADLDSESKAYAVTENRAWTWPEVYFEGLGWVEFNPTPGRPLIARPGADAALGDLVAASVGDDDQGFPLSNFEIPVAPTIDRGGVQREITSALATALTWLSLLGLPALAAWVGVRGLWTYWFRGLPPAGARWAKLQLLGAWAGSAVQVNRTPLENAARLGSVVGDDLDLTPLAADYTRERYGGEAAPPAETADDADTEDGETARLTRLYVAARKRLLRRIFRYRLRLRRR